MTKTRSEIGSFQFRFPVSDLLFLVIVFLFLLDAATTAYGLSIGFHETNPIMIFIMNNFGFTGAILAMTLGLGSVYLGGRCLELLLDVKGKVRNQWLSAPVYLTAILVESFIVMQNLNQLL